MKRNYYIKQVAFIPPPYGGVSVYVKRLVDQLRVDGFFVGVYYKGEKHKEEKYSRFYNKWTWLETSRYFIKIWKFIIENRSYDILHSHFGLEAMPYLWTLKKFFNKKIVVTIHNSMVTEYYSKTNFINKYFIKLMLSSDVCWVTVSEQGKEQLLSLNLKILNPVDVIPAYIPDMNEDSTELNGKIQEYINAHTKNIFYYAHSFMRYKNEYIYGFDTMLGVYAELSINVKDIGLIFCIAECDDIIRLKEIYEVAKSLNIFDKIYWQLGPVSNMKKIWSLIDVYFRPTSTDGDSVAIREAIDFGVSVVASDVCVRPDKVSTYRYGNIQDAYEKVLLALESTRKMLAYNMDYYEKMKTIYLKILKER